MSSSANANRGAPPPRRVYKSVYDVFHGIETTIVERALQAAPEYNNCNDGQSWLDERVQFIIRNVLLLQTFSLYLDGLPVSRTFSKANLDKITRRFYTFYSVIARNAFRLHSNGMFSTANGLLVEITANVARRGPNAVRRGSFDLKKFESKLSSWMTWEGIHAEGVYKMRNTRMRADAYYPYIFDSNCRGLLQALFIHTTGILGMACTLFENNSTESIPKHPNLVIKGLTSTIVGGYAQSLKFITNAESLNFFRGKIWPEVTEDVLRLANKIYEWWILGLPIDERIRYGKVPAARRHTSEKLYIRNVTYNNRLNPFQLLRFILGEDEHCLDFWARTASHLFHCFLVKGQGLFGDIVRVPRFEAVYQESITNFFKTIHELIITTIHQTQDSFSNGEEGAEHLITLLREGRDVWIDNVINKLKQNPIRYMEAEEINSILLHEDNSRVEIVHVMNPPAPARSDIMERIGYGIEREQTEIDIDATIDRYDHDREQNNAATGGRVVLLCVQEPPDGCLDEVGKCKSCGIDWSKLDGRVQILKCPPGTNVDNMNEIMRRTIDQANNAINDVIAQRQRDRDGVQDDSNEENVRHVQVQIPVGRNAQETVQIDSTVINQLIRFPITLTEGLDTGNHRRILDAAPSLVDLIFNRIRSLTNRRRITQGGESGNVEDRVPAGSEVTVSMTEVINQEDNDENENDNRRVRVDIQKKTPAPVVPDEVIDNVIEEAGLGSVNRNAELSFSVANAEDDMQTGNVRVPARRYSFLRSVPIRREDDQSSDVPIRLTVEGLDATNARNITILYILTKWVKEGRFEHARLASVENWVKMNIFCSTGPLSQSRDFNQPKNAIAACNTFEEIIGTYSILTAYDLYCQLHDVLVTRSNWNDVGERTHRMVHRYHGDEVQKGVTYMNFRISHRENIRRHLSLYSVVVVYQYNRRRIGNEEQLIRVSRRMGIVVRIDVGHDQQEKVDIIRILDIVKCQPSEDEYMEQQFLERHPRNVDYFCYLKNVGYTGPSIRYSDYQNSIRVQPLAFGNILKQQKTIGNQYTRIQPFSATIQNDVNTLTQFLTTNCTLPFRQQYFNLLYGINPLIFDDDPNGNLSPAELPAIPMAAQITAIVQSCQCVDENMNITDDKRIDSQVFTIVGPAGTGKTTTLVQIINALLNREQVAVDIITLYSDMEQMKAGLTNGPGQAISTPPEDVIRILVVTETNQALEEIEMRINRGFHIRWEESSLRRVIPMYSKVATRHNSENETIPMLYDIPEVFKQQYTGPITLTTVGSLHKAFSNRQLSQSRVNRGLPQYDVVIMDEASQIGVRSWIMSTVISQPASHCSSKVTYIVCGDPYQNTPMSFGPRSRFTRLSSVSIMDLLLPNASTAEFSFAPWVQLNVQFRMHELISRLSNSITNRLVDTHPSVVNDTPSRITTPFFHLVNDNFEPNRTGFVRLTEFHHQCAVVWVNPYNCRIPLRSAPNLPNHWNRMYNTSYLEAATVTNLVENVIEEGVFDYDQLLILTPYNQQVSLIYEMLQQRYQYLRTQHDENEVPPLDRVEVSTVGSIQGAERHCVIFSTVRNQADRGGGIGILGELNTTYVAITRAKFKLYIVGDKGYLRGFDVWKEVTSFLDGQKPPLE